VPDPGGPPVGVATLLGGSCEPTETRHRMETLGITQGRISKKAQCETGKPNRIGG
jgi:hypothetical protein